MKFVRVAALCAALLSLGIAAMACGDDDDGDDGNGGDEQRPTATQGVAASPTTTGEGGSPTAGAGGGADEVAVTAADFSFTPSTFSINRTSTTTITLTNTGDLPHTIHVYYDAGYTDALVDTGTVAAGDTGEATIDNNDTEEADELFFRCSIHPSQMQGTITVQ